MYQLAGAVVRIFLNLFGRIKVYDKDKLIKDEGYVIACTHSGWVEILWLGVALLPDEIHYMAKKELFENRFVGWLITKFNAFPVDRENPGPSSIKTPVKIIKEKKIVGIFPSGTRTTEDVPLKRGAVTIASYAKAPIIPAAYVGPSNFKELLKRKKPKLVFGDPIYLNEDLPKKEAIEALTNELDQTLKNLQQKISS